MDSCFQVGTFPFRLCVPDGLTLPDNLRKFAAADSAYRYVFRCVEEVAPPEGKPLLRRSNLTVWVSPFGETRLLSLPARQGQALYREQSEREAEVFLTPDWLSMLQYDTVLTSLLALERRLIGLDGLVLHCAYLRHLGEAILFSAPSETGKSTQAGLWEQYRGGETINGDRALLQKLDGRWTARGWPVCGSSGICRNEDTPIRAIVMLSQAPENRVERLHPAQAFALLYGQITVNRWNRAATARAVGLIEDLIGTVPVFHLGCTISEKAVDCLDAALSAGTA